jgi:hypothetical protein
MDVLCDGYFGYAKAHDVAPIRTTAQNTIIAKGEKTGRKEGQKERRGKGNARARPFQSSRVKSAIG